MPKSLTERCEEGKPSEKKFSTYLRQITEVFDDFTTILNNNIRCEVDDGAS